MSCGVIQLQSTVHKGHFKLVESFSAPPQHIDSKKDQEVSFRGQVDFPERRLDHTRNRKSRR